MPEGKEVSGEHNKISQTTKIEANSSTFETFAVKVSETKNQGARHSTT